MKRAINDLVDKTYDKFANDLLARTPCEYDPVVESHFADYASDLGSEVSGVDMAHRAWCGLWTTF